MQDEDRDKPANPPSRAPKSKPMPRPNDVSYPNDDLTLCELYFWLFLYGLRDLGEREAVPWYSAFS